jgi:hypothetical protein
LPSEPTEAAAALRDALPDEHRPWSAPASRLDNLGFSSGPPRRPHAGLRCPQSLRIRSRRSSSSCFTSPPNSPKPKPRSPGLLRRARPGMQRRPHDPTRKRPHHRRQRDAAVSVRSYIPSTQWSCQHARRLVGRVRRSREYERPTLRSPPQDVVLWREVWGRSDGREWPPPERPALGRPCQEEPQSRPKLQRRSIHANDAAQAGAIIALRVAFLATNCAHRVRSTVRQRKKPSKYAKSQGNRATQPTPARFAPLVVRRQGQNRRVRRRTASRGWVGCVLALTDARAFVLP